MATIGSLTHIAEQETIYSTRFIGDRLYMVTFKRIDPFFVIDLSTPASPEDPRQAEDPRLLRLPPPL